jgi:hypothetical protein
MYINKHTKKVDLPEGNYILHCENYASNTKYFLINKKIAVFEVFNTKYAFAKQSRKISDLEGQYKAVEIPIDKYGIFNI